MSETPGSDTHQPQGLKEVRYSLRQILEEVQKEREGSSLGQEMVDQMEIGKLFSRKQKVRRVRSRK